MTESSESEKKSNQTQFNLGLPTMPVNKIIRDDRLYPRKKVSHKTIDSYAEALKCDAKFPPVLLQKVLTKEGEKQTVILDGFHRTEAHKQIGKDKIPYHFWKDQRLPLERHLHELRVVSIQRNLTHGDRLANSDKKVMCKTMAEEDSDITLNEEDFAEIFKVTRQTINNWISNIRARQRGSRDNLIVRLSKLGWNQKTIAEKVGLDRTTISKNVKNANFGKIHNSYHDDQKSISELSEFYGYDTQVIWSILLEGLSDQEKFNLFYEHTKKECKWELYNIWNFSNRDDRLGIQADGNIAGQIVMNLLYYYTEQSDLVLDPMAGGGSTVDACLVMNRECIAYDLKPKRDDIIQNNSVNEIPTFITSKKLADFVFIDPPYYTMVSAIQNYEDIEDFYSQMRQLFKNTSEKLRKEGYIAVLIGQLAPTIKESTNLAAECYNILKGLGLEYINRISVPHSTQQTSPHAVNKYKKIKELLTRDRTLWVFKKTERSG